MKRKEAPTLWFSVLFSEQLSLKMSVRVKKNNRRPNATRQLFCPLEPIIFELINLNSPAAVKREKDQSHSGQTPETPPRLCWFIPGLKIRFDPFDFNKFNGGVTTKSFSHTLFYCLTTSALILVYCLFDDGEEPVRRKRKHVKKNKPEKNRNLAATCYELDFLHSGRL